MAFTTSKLSLGDSVLPKSEFGKENKENIIAVKVVDNEGLEAIEVIKVKVNGELEVGE